MKELLPNEFKQCWIIWYKVYKEYMRIGYRLGVLIFKLKKEILKLLDKKRM